MAPERPNVVLVVMDTARARELDVLSDTGHISTVDDLRKSGTEYVRAYSSSPWTLPSHASMFTGTYTSKHGVRADQPRLGTEVVTLAEAFADAGYETIAVSNNTWVSESFGLTRGFETLFKTWQLLQSETDLGAIARIAEGRERLRALGRRLLRGNTPANVLNGLYGRFLRKRGDDGAKRTNRYLKQYLTDRDNDRPLFLFVNYLEPHLEYRPPREFAKPFLPHKISFDAAYDVPQDAWRYMTGNLELSECDFAALRALYRGEIAYLDRRIGELLSLLERSLGLSNTVFALTSDHGENIGDHGLMDHQYALTETLIRIPLIIRGPEFRAEERSLRLLNLLDLVPTLLDSADLDAPELRRQVQGVSFHPKRGMGPRERVFAEYLAPQPSMEALSKRVGELSADVRKYDRQLRAVRTAEHKLVRSSTNETWLYEIETDPDEETDLSETKGRVVERLNDDLDTWLSSFDHATVQGDIDVPDTLEDRLEDLGYLR